MNDITEKYMSQIQVNHEYDIKRFVNEYGYTNIMRMIPAGGAKADRISAELMAVCIVTASKIMMDDYDTNDEVEVDNIYKIGYPKISAIAPVRDLDNTPFFNSGYFGIVMNDINGNKFYFMIESGKIGLEDMKTAYAQIGNASSPHIDLTFGQNRQFGDYKIHREDFEKAVEILTEKLLNRLYCK